MVRIEDYFVEKMKWNAERNVTDDKSKRGAQETSNEHWRDEKVHHADLRLGDVLAVAILNKWLY